MPRFVRLSTFFAWCFAAMICGAGLVLASFYLYLAPNLPDAEQLKTTQLQTPLRIYSADNKKIAEFGEKRRTPVSYLEIPSDLINAFVAAEDNRFFEHGGIDLKGLARATTQLLTTGRIVSGGSTITMQVVENFFLSRERTFIRKFNEIFLALQIEQSLKKEEILELYMNRVYFGSGAYGIEAAAQTYFGVSARNLSLGQAAMLVGILPAPSAYNPKANPDTARDRQRLVLNAMAQEGYITRQEADAARINPDQTIRTVVAGSESYVADWVESLMTAYIGEIEGDVVVQTTIDYKMQKDAEFIVKEAVANEGEKRGFSQAALVAMDVDGTVRAMVGGVDYQASQYNRAVTARRQPGSAFKPFVYMAAMEKGYTPDTLAEDAQFDYNGWSPRNSSGKYAGTVTLRQGLAYSLNTIAARLAIDVTPEKVIEVAMRMGISSNLSAVPSIALGAQEVNLLELTSAYAPFANGGMGVIPNVITKISDVEGNVLYEASNAGPGRVVDPNVLAAMNDMLKTAVEVGTGRGANIGGWEVGGKTGTSQESRDALFVGYTSAMVTGVWLGNDNDTGTSLSGGNVPANIWSNFMTKALEGRSPAPIPGGSYAGQLIAQQLIDPNTGMPAIDPATGQPMVQYVDGGTGQPVQTTTDPATGQVIAIDPATGAPIEGLAPVSGQTANAPIQTGTMIDPATGQPVQQLDPNTGLPIDQGQLVQYDANGQAIDPVTGFPLQQQSNGFGQAPIDPETGLPMTLVVDPATGQQVWVPSAPTQQQGFTQPQGQIVPPGQVQQQPVYQEERSQRTLMDLIFGN